MSRCSPPTWPRWRTPGSPPITPPARQLPRSARATKRWSIGAGGLGHIGVQVLKALTPAELIVVDRSREALGLVEQLGAEHLVNADGGQVEAVLDLTGGGGAQAVIDFVGEGGAIEDGVAMLRRAGNYYVIGYGETLAVPTIDTISTEINFVGNLVGSYTDLDELMVLAAQGKVSLHTSTYPLVGSLHPADQREDLEGADPDAGAGAGDP